ncbi:MAG: hypothetical protein WAT19_05810 [Ferruginibacter sp.]
MNYDIYLFLEIIDSIPEVQYLRDGERAGTKVKYYQGKNGNKVIIDISKEYPGDSTLKIHLENLGLFDLIKSMFPKNEESKNSYPDIHDVLKELKLDKDENN